MGCDLCTCEVDLENQVGILVLKKILRLIPRSISGLALTSISMSMSTFQRLSTKTYRAIQGPHTSATIRRFAQAIVVKGSVADPYPLQSGVLTVART
jgi:hypothetical protein